jgi:hypothetical protein
MSTQELPDTESWGGAVKAITAVVYLLFFVASYSIVRGSLGWVCGEDGWCISSSAPWKFWFLIPAFPAFGAWLIARRLLEGPSVQRDDLVVFFNLPGGAAGAGPRLADLLAGLAAVGYTPRAFQVDDSLRPTSPATGLEALLGTKFLIQEPRGRGRRAFLRLALSAGPRGTGVIEVSDTERGFYAELATYVVRDLASLLPDLKFRRLNSALSPEVGRDMKLPPRPAQLA